jgi:hypothetical protein
MGRQALEKVRSNAPYPCQGFGWADRKECLLLYVHGRIFSPAAGSKEEFFGCDTAKIFHVLCPFCQDRTVLVTELDAWCFMNLECLLYPTVRAVDAQLMSNVGWEMDETPSYREGENAAIKKTRDDETLSMASLSA